MANQEHVAILKQGGEVWNRWRQEHPEERPELNGAILTDVDLHDVELDDANLSGADLSGANLEGSDLGGAYLRDAKLREANLTHVSLKGADLWGACLNKANLTEAVLGDANLNSADLSQATLTEAHLDDVNFFRANLDHADLRRAELIRADFMYANLYSANLREANLCRANLVDTNLEGADLTGCYIYGISVWNARLKGAMQKDLVISENYAANITVDDLETAQFIYLLLHNQKIQQVIETITSKVVLIVGHFAGERKSIAEAVKHDLRTQHYSPVVFDVGALDERNLRETIRILANLARFVLIDLTELDHVLDEIIRIAPYCRVPIQPLLTLESSQYKYTRFLDLRRAYRWILPLYWYKDNTGLCTSLQTKIIQPAEAKSEELQRREPVRVFCCYAQEDAELLARLKKHLTPFERSGQIVLWDDQEVVPGEEKAKEIERHVSDAQIILLLVSPDFLSSDDCVALAEQAMERYGRGDAIVIPLLLRPCSWRSTALGKLQVLPRDERPVIHSDLDTIFLK